MSRLKTRFAIVGAGFSGLASAYFLSYSDSNSITIFDPGNIGENASGLAAGLLHPFSGQRAKKAPDAEEGLKESLALLNTVSAAMKHPVFTKTGMLRPALTPFHEHFFQESAKKHPEAIWLTAEECQEKSPGIVNKPSLFVPDTYQVDTKLYLQGLWEICQSRGVVWEKKKIASLEELKSFDKVILATGASLLPEISDLPINPVKGQLLMIDWNEKLPYPVNPGVYLVRSQNITIAGATYEHHFQDSTPDLAIAKSLLLPRIAEIFPTLANAPIIGCKAALRASAPLHQPFLKEVMPNTWLLSGMGSKGLLYHALYAKKLAFFVNH